MTSRSLRSRLFLSYLMVIVVLGGLIVPYGYGILKSNVVGRSQRQLKRTLKMARNVFELEIREIKTAFGLASLTGNPALIKTQLNLDYLYSVEDTLSPVARGETVRQAFHGNASGGIRIIDSAELHAMGMDLYQQAAIPILETPKAHPTTRTVLTSAMAAEYALPFLDETGRVVRVLYGGRILNRNFDIVDRIRGMIIDDQMYQSKPVGTVTIFLDDVRIATNVLTKTGERAIGTRVSAAVYDKVLMEGKPWIDRAFVVTDWYLTAYEPIRDINGKIVGSLYVGLLEQPFNDLLRNALIVFAAIMGGAVIIALILALILANRIARPITRLVNATDQLAAGDLEHRVDTSSSIGEINRLALEFNEMAEKLAARDAGLREANEELEVLNKRYLDLVGMVSHELKGILASTVLNAYSVRDGYLGPVNDTQRKALEGVTRNLEYFDMTVKNFLNLSRIEKGELALSPADVRLREDIVEGSVDAFKRQAEDKRMQVRADVPPDIALRADASLLFMVLNNLIGNAVKYGTDGGTIAINARHDAETVTVSVYNDGRPLTEPERARLFKRFSRLDSPEGRKVRGTGLGLFLCKEIVARHGGDIRCEAREKGNEFIFTIRKQLAG